MTSQPEQGSASPPPSRFTLAALFELIAGIALFLGLLVELGFVGFFIAAIAGAIVLAAHHVIFARDRGEAWRKVGLGCLGCLILGLVTMCFLSLPLAHSGRGVARAAYCRNNLRMLALALLAYHEVHGHFPPSYIPDANGKPMHSWRVLILPHVERSDLYEAYNFNEPWNGPNNSKLSAQMPNVFRCPSQAALPESATHYFFVATKGGEGGSSKLRLSHIKDEPTILLMESSTVQVNWLEPRDLTVEEIVAAHRRPSNRATSSRHNFQDAIWREGGWFHIALHDGSAHRLSENIDADTLRALLTIDGGEKVDLPAYGITRTLRPEFFILVSLTVAIVALAILRRLRLARDSRKSHEQPA